MQPLDAPTTSRHPAAIPRYRSQSPSHTVKTRPSIIVNTLIPLWPEAAAVLSRIPRLADNPFVIPGRIRGKAMRNLYDSWEIVCERAGLKDMRLHDCRHSYASRALALGESLPMIGKLLGHTQVERTARYAHLAQGSVKESAVRVADSIGGDLLAKYPGSAAL